MTLRSCFLILCLLFTASVTAQAETTLNGLDKRVRVVRDSSGIAHIFAKKNHGLFFMQGWVHAQDRLFQMDLFRDRPPVPWPNP